MTCAFQRDEERGAAGGGVAKGGDAGGRAFARTGERAAQVLPAAARAMSEVFRHAAECAGHDGSARFLSALTIHPAPITSPGDAKKIPFAPAASTQPER